jgi:hypothetical protein
MTESYTDRLVPSLNPPQRSFYSKKMVSNTGSTMDYGAESRRLESSAPNDTGISKLLLERACGHCGIGVERKSQRWGMALRKWCLPDSTGQLHISTHRNCDIYKTCVSSSHTKSQYGEQRWASMGAEMPPPPSKETTAN